VKFEYLDGQLVRRESFVQTRKTGSAKYEYDAAGYLAVRIRYDRTGKLVETNEYSYIEVEK
jgi:YD repeat-containing protein